MATKHVAKTGSNANNGNTLATAYLTVNFGLGQIGTSGTLIVHGTAPGVRTNYNEGIASAPSGTVDAYTNIIAFPGDNVWLTPTSNANSAAATGMVVWFDGSFHFINFDGINIDGTALTGASYVIWVSTNNSNDPHDIYFNNAEVIAGDIGGGAAIGLGGHTLIGATGSNKLVNLVIHGGGLPGLCGFECASYAVYVEGPNNLVDGCDMYDTSGAGVHIYNAGGDSPDNTIIRNNKIHDISRLGDAQQSWGIISAGFSGPILNTQIYNNLIYNISVGGNTGDGGIVLSFTDGSTVYNNTVDNILQSGLVLYSTENSFIQNNTFYQCAQLFNDLGGNSGNTLNHNIIDGSNPMFVSSGTGDYRVTNTSIAYRAGVAVVDLTTDYAGSPYNNPPTIGAYEVVEASGVWTRIAGAKAGSIDRRQASAGPLNTTGANLIVVSTGRYTGESPTADLTDSYGNLWVPLTEHLNANGIANLAYYAIDPIVGASHTFIYGDAGIVFPALCVEAWFCASIEDVGGQNGAVASSGATIATGGVTSSSTNSIFFACLTFDANGGSAVSIDSSFAANVQPLTSDFNMGCGIAFAVPAAAVTENPSWDVGFSTVDGLAASIVMFTSAAVSSIIPIELSHFRRRR